MGVNSVLVEGFILAGQCPLYVVLEQKKYTAHYAVLYAPPNNAPDALNPGRRSSLTSDLVDRLSKTLDVAGGDTGDGNPAVLGSIDRVLQKRLALCSKWDQSINSPL
jgi:hypothetical protein